MSALPTVSVRGQSLLFVDPELVEFQVSVRAEAATQALTLESLSRRAAELADVVGRFEPALEYSETSRMSISPILDHKKTERVRRYAGHVSIRVCLHDFTDLSDLVVQAGSVELATVAGPWWRLRETSDAYRQARLAAVEDALARARDYAAAVGSEVVELVELADTGLLHEQAPEPGMMARASLGWGGQAAEADATFELEPERQRVSGQIEARFQISVPDLSVVP